MHKNGCIAVNAQSVHVCHQAAMVLQSAVQQNDLQWRICYIIANGFKLRIAKEYT